MNSTTDLRLDAPMLPTRRIIKWAGGFMRRWDGTLAFTASFATGTLLWTVLR